jgi:hypothetical protein
MTEDELLQRLTVNHEILMESQLFAFTALLLKVFWEC